MRSENLDMLKTLQDLDSRGELIGCFNDIAIDVYHHNESPGYSSTTIKRIIEKSYNHWFIQKAMNARALEFGSAFHCFVNEPHLFNELFVVAQTDSRRSGEWREAKKNSGDKTVIDNDDFECLKVMADKLYSHPDIGPYLSSAKYEHTYYVRDEKTGLLKKCKVDILSNGVVFDLKSTIDASEEGFRSFMRKNLQRISSSYYLEILSEHYKVPHTDFRLVACEKLEPREINVFRVHPQSIEKAQFEIRVALDTIKNILDNGPSAWKGYPLGVKDIFI